MSLVQYPARAWQEATELPPPSLHVRATALRVCLRRTYLNCNVASLQWLGYVSNHPRWPHVRASCLHSLIAGIQNESDRESIRVALPFVFDQAQHVSPQDRLDVWVVCTL